MKLVAACCFFLLPLAHAQTLRLSWKPADFQPLTDLPWAGDEPPDVAKIIERIFREPNPDIRYPVLAAYLRKIPMHHFALAFDVAVMFEGAQNPNDVVALMLRIWAERDPQEAWEHTQSLAQLVGFEDGWLSYDSWNKRPKITVQDLAAIRASRYWLTSSALLAFPDGVEASQESQAEQARLIKAFGTLWFERFQYWPRERHPRYSSQNEGVLGMFESSYEFLQHSDVGPIEKLGGTPFEVGLRRWLFKHPEDGPKIVQCILRKHWDAVPETNTPAQDATISRDFLLLWSQIAPDGLLAWAATAEQTSPNEAWTAKCLLMDHVDKATREKWLSSLETKELDTHLCMLAPWHPELAMQRAILTKNFEIIQNVASSAVYGYRGGRVWNACHGGLGFINAFDRERLPQNLREGPLTQCGIIIMEQWGCVDVGEAARYGFRFLMEQSWLPRAELLRFFSGEDLFADESGMIDRTFCALRVWAVIRPDEMHNWIKDQSGADTRKALTWLLEHPWGNG